MGNKPCFDHSTEHDSTHSGLLQPQGLELAMAGEFCVAMAGADWQGHQLKTSITPPLFCARLLTFGVLVEGGHQRLAFCDS